MIGWKAARRQVAFDWTAWVRVAGPPVVAVVFVLAAMFPTFPGDRWALQQMPMLHNPWLTGLGVGLAYVGWLPVAAGLSLSALTLLWLYGGRVRFMVASAGAGLVVLSLGLKVVVGRPRPEYLLEAASSGLPGFPSGHTVFATIFCGLAIMFVAEWAARRDVKVGVGLGMALLALVTGASRVYLGVHLPSDVLGGWLYGGVALVELAWLRQRLGRGSMEGGPSSGLATSGF